MSTIIIFAIIILFIYFMIFTKTGKNILKKFFSKIIVIIFTALICISVIIFIIRMFINYTFISFLTLIEIILFFSAIEIVNTIKDKIKHADIYNKWLEMPLSRYTEDEVENQICQFSLELYDKDKNKTERKFKENIPIGRATFFTSFFDKTMNDESVVYFSPISSKNKNEIREYGTLVTTGGIYISKQDKKGKKDKVYVRNYYIPFSGLIGIIDKSSLLVFLYPEYKKKINLYNDISTVDIKTIKNIVESIINSGISKAINMNEIYNAQNIADEEQEKFNRILNASKLADSTVTAGTASTIFSDIEQYSQTGYTMGKYQGHGDAAEYANTVLSRAKGDFKAVQVGGDNSKNGADIISYADGVESQIQCKYCKTANDTANNILSHDYPDDMVMEVPKGQGQIIRQKLAESGKHYKIVEGVSYSFAEKVSMSGTIEGLTIDTIQGVMCSAGYGSITAILCFATCKWNGMTSKDAALEGLKSGAKVIGKGTAIYVLSMQLGARSRIVGGLQNPVYKIGNNLANKINTSDIAKSKVGQNLKLNKINGQAIISGGVIFAVTFGPDIWKTISGRISFQQLLKNSTISGASIAGATVGQAIIPIPIVGSVVGGTVAGFVAKKTLDKFCEDDAVKMFEILKEEFIDAVAVAGLTKNEVDEVVNVTVAHPELKKVLENMYQFGDSRKYARNNIMGKAIISVYEKREKITEDMYLNALNDVCTELDNSTIEQNVFKTCPQCGGSVKRQAKFCKKCGYKF